MSHFRGCWLSLVAVAVLAGCGVEGGADEPMTGVPPLSASSNPLEASGKMEFFVTIMGFPGESFSARRPNAIPAIRYYANIVKPDTGATRCVSVRFTKATGVSDPEFHRALSSGRTLPPVLLEFIKPGQQEFVWQTINITQLRVSRVEQAVAPPDDMTPSALLEEVTFEPNNTSTFTITSIPQNADGTPGTPIVAPFSCSR